MRCPVCGATELIHDTRDVPYTYKSETTIIPTVTGAFCPACDTQPQHSNYQGSNLAYIL